METAIYCRVSTEEQATEGFSIRAQEQKLKEYVNVKDWSVYNVYLDEGISGKNITERPAINRMITDIKAGRVKNVLVFKIDRLTRSTADLVYLIDLFKEYDCAFNSLMESIDTATASGRMFIKIIGIFAEFERENIAERTRVGFERKAREGYTNASRHASYGYDRAKGQKIQTINENEAEYVREIFDMYVNQGMSLTGIARKLNIRGIPTKGNSNWNAACIGKVITNCNYIGNVRYSLHESARNFETAGLHEAIITPELFNEAQIMIDKNKKITPTKKPTEKNFMAGFVYCAKCGGRLSPHYTRPNKQKGGAIISYSCRNKDISVCDAKSVTASKIEQALREYFKRVDDLTVSDKVELEEQKQKVRQNIEEQINVFTEKMSKVDTRKKEVMRFYTSGNIEYDDYCEMKKQLDSDKDFINNELIKLKTALGSENEAKITRADVVTDFIENWDKLSNIEKRQFLTNFVKKIYVVNNPIEGKSIGNTVITNVDFYNE